MTTTEVTTMPIMEKCRQCGCRIMLGIFGRDSFAKKRGFCSANCEETYDAINADLHRQAQKESGL